LARPQKEGLDYFPLDTDMDLQDDKIQLLEAKYGITGFGVLIKLLMKIYSEGYYYTWGEKESLLLSKRVNVDVNKVDEIVADLVKWGMFDSQIFKKYKVLTSNGIQKRYWEVAKRRNAVTIIKQYWLYDVGNILSNVNINLQNVDIGTQSKVKNSKEKNNNIYIKCQHLSMTEEEYKKLVEAYGESEVKDKLEYAENYAKLKNYKSLYKTLNNWLKNDREKGGIGNGADSGQSKQNPGYDKSKWLATDD
jgi:hypothetical protein